MIFLYRKLRYAALVAFVLFAASCGGGGGSNGAAGGLGDSLAPADTGTVTVLATDAETDLFSEVNLTIIRAEFLGGEGGSELLFEGEKTINLLALANVTELLSVAEVPAGSYNKIRLTLTQIELVFHDEERPPEYPRLPGNGKLDINPRGAFYVDSDNPLTIQLDFDAEKSIKIVGTGSGKFNFRPVVFTKEVENSFDTKLIRQTGVVRNLADSGGSFDLCLVDSGESDEEDCMHVVTGGDTAIFNESGESIGPGDLENGVIATVVGRLVRDDASSVASADTGYLVCEEVEGELICEETEEPEAPLCEEIEGQLICEGGLVCEEVEGELVCEEIEEPEAPLCEVVEGQLICDDLACEEVEGQLICEGNLVCDDVGDELVCEEIDEEEEAEECVKYKGELICEKDCEVVKGKLICGETEEECFKFKGDLICEEDCEVVKGELSCEDDGPDDEGGSGNMVLLADLIWLGDNFSRTENVACGPVIEDVVLGASYQNAELNGEEVPSCDDGNSRSTVLLPGARIYDDTGNPLGPEAIEVGVINIVDGILADSGLQAVLVIVEPSEAEEASRTQLSGTIGVLEDESFSLITEVGDRCVLFDDSDTVIFVTGLDEEGNIIFDETGAASLAAGQRADAFGEQNAEGCLEAETLIIETE
jgi:hypothetical protein